MSELNIEIDLSNYRGECLKQVIESYSFEQVKDAFLEKGLKLDRFTCIDEIEYIQKEREYFLGVFKLDLSNIPIQLLLTTIDINSEFMNSVCLFVKNGTLYIGSTNGTAITTIAIQQDKFEVICNPILDKLNNNGIILPSELIRVLASFTSSGWGMQFQLAKTESSLLIKLQNSRTKQVIFLVSDLLEGVSVKYLDYIESNHQKQWDKIGIPLESLLPILGLFSNSNTIEAKSIYFDVSVGAKPLKFCIESLSFNLLEAVNIASTSNLNVQDTKFYLFKEDLYNVLSQYDPKSILTFVFNYRDKNPGSLIIEYNEVTHLFVPKSISRNRN